MYLTEIRYQFVHSIHPPPNRYRKLSLLSMVIYLVPSDSIIGVKFLSQTCDRLLLKICAPWGLLCFRQKDLSIWQCCEYNRHIHTRIWESDQCKINKKISSERLVSFCMGEKHPQIKWLL